LITSVARLYQSHQVSLSIFRNYLKTQLTLYLKILNSVLLHPTLLPFELWRMNALNFVFQYFNQPKDLAFWTLTCGSYPFSHILSHVLRYQPFELLALPGFP
jgi:hypothetical protein